MPPPESATLAVVVRLLLVAVSDAVAAPIRVGMNRTESAHDLPGPKLGGQVSEATVNAADPDTLKVMPPDARPPMFVSVNDRSRASPTGTCPYAYGVGWSISSGGSAAAD